MSPRITDQWRVQCSVSWCRQVEYTSASLPEATALMLEHWHTDHPRRLRRSRGRSAGGFVAREVRAT